MFQQSGYQDLEEALRAIYPERPWHSGRFLESGRVGRGCWKDTKNIIKAVERAEVRTRHQAGNSRTNWTAAHLALAGGLVHGVDGGLEGSIRDSKNHKSAVSGRLKQNVLPISSGSESSCCKANTANSGDSKMPLLPFPGII